MKLRYNDAWMRASCRPAGRALPLHGGGLGRRLRVVAPRTGAAGRMPPTSALAARVGGPGMRAARHAASGAEQAALEDGALALEQGAQGPTLEAAALKGAGPTRTWPSPRAHSGPFGRLEAPYGADLPGRCAALQHLVRAVPALGRRRARRARHLARCRARGCRWSRPWASTCCTSRRSIRSAACSARAATTRSTTEPGDVGSPWAHRRRRGRPQGDSARPRDAGGLPPPGRRGPGPGARDRDGHRLPVRTRPSLREGASRSGSAGGPTAACSTPRTRRRSTRTSIPSTSRAKTGRASGANSRACSTTGSREGVHDLPGRQPAHQGRSRSGNGRSPKCKRAHPETDLPGRSLHPAEGHASARQAGLHAVLHLLHLAQHQGTSSPTISPSSRRARARTTSGPNVWPNTPDILHAALQGGEAGDVQAAAGAGRHAGRQLRHLRPGLRTAASTCRAGLRARSISTRRNTSCATGTGIPTAACGPSSPGSTASGTGNAALQSDRSLRFLDIDNDQLIAYHQGVPTMAAMSW